MAVIESLAGPNSRYRTVWLAGVVGLAVLGVLSSFVFISWGINLAVFAIAVSMYASIHFQIGLVAGMRIPALVLAALDGSLSVGLGTLAVCGYIATAGVSALLLLPVIAGTSPLVVAYLSEPTPDRGEVRPASESESEGEAVSVLRGSTEELSVEELCLAWRRSFTQLSDARTDQERLAAVSARGIVLGELERRDPQGFAEWLDSGPRAAGDPTRYFTHQAGRGGRPG
jgi:hypothetical protein